MMTISPLRYAGGKFKIYSYIKNLIIQNGYTDRVYVEAFGGGFAVGLGLLYENIVPSVVFNDFDKNLYNFWFSVLYKTEELIEKIYSTPISLEQRGIEKERYKQSADILESGFATLYLNRVNFSGIIKGGPLGGLKQEKTKLDCRFNREVIEEKIRAVALMKDRITLLNIDACDLFEIANKKKCFYYLDPPYFQKGKQLYSVYFEKQDHVKLKESIERNLSNENWILTYDVCDFIKDLYKNHEMKEFPIAYSVNGAVRNSELVIANVENFIWGGINDK